MAIVKMKNLRLYGLAEEEPQLMKALQLLGCVELRNVPDGSGDWRVQRGEGVQTLQQSADMLALALQTLGAYEGKSGGLFAPRPKKTLEELFDDAAYAAAQETAQKIRRTQEQLLHAQAQKSRLNAEKERFLPWRTLDLPLETTHTRHTVVLLGTVSAQTDVASLLQAAAEATDEAEVKPISEDRQSRYLLIFVHKQAQAALMPVLREAGFAQRTFDGVSGTAEENLRRIQAQIERCADEETGLAQTLRCLAAEKPALLLAADRCAQELARAQAAERLLHSEKTFCLDGWLPCEQVQELTKLLGSYCCAWTLRDPTPEEYPDVPVKLKNNRLTRPLNMVTEMYSLPAYDGVDPNPLMAPFFILFYGIMMADMGYGLLMMLASVLITKKAQPRGTSGHLFGLMFSCGISTFIMGALTGGFFGDFLPQLVGLIDPDTTFHALPALFTPLDDTIAILLGAMALGFVQIVTGMAISFVEKLKKGQIMDAVWEELTWWVVFAGIGCAAFGLTTAVLYVGLAMILVGAGWNAHGFGRVTAVFGSVYNHVTGYFGDILSYSRLMTLMLAGSVIASVFNTLGAIPGNVVFFLLVSALGNGLNFALNLLSCYVHDLRLQCLEYFGKFYKDGGKPFQPLAIQTNHVDI